MPPERRGEEIGLVLSAAVIVIAALLAYRQWKDRQRRETDLPEADAAHFVRQDTRRWLGAFVMILLALGLAVGMRLPHIAGGKANTRFVQVWLGVFLLIFVLLLLALLDWLAPRVYARRHRRAIVQERDETLRDLLRRRSYPGNGQAGPSNPVQDPLPPEPGD